MPEPVLTRQAVFHRGARFFERDGEILYEFNADASTRMGPRQATEADREAHPKAWEAFLEGREPESPLKPVVEAKDERSAEEAAADDAERESRREARESRRKAGA